jgi:hypothetical protein
VGLVVGVNGRHGNGDAGGRTNPPSPPPDPKVMEITHLIERLDPPIRAEAPHQAAVGQPACNSV